MGMSPLFAVGRTGLCQEFWSQDSISDYLVGAPGSACWSEIGLPD